ncbi:MAG: TIGR03619 family F420-dependent LLM class oxidoreductase [Acidimicrobiales bacterium]|nr:TIGR03619 family F420-dependent LLM class oxidoreductase [Acidimicrobiales bacterium]
MGRYDAEGVSFGIQLPIQGQSTLFAEGWEAHAGVDELSSVATVAERAGFAYVAVCDHVAVPKDHAHALTSTWWDCIATLSYLAAVTRRIRLLSHVYVLPFRHPLLAAKQWLTLDALSSGRAILGVGAGYVEGEFEALGVDHGRRGALLDESIDALRAAFEGEYSSHHGDAWSYDEMGLAPRPHQGGVPIWVGGSSPAALRRAAERGDGWLPAGPPEGGMSAGIARLRELRERAGRADEPFTVGALSGPLYVGEPRWDVGRAVHGSPEQIASFLRVLAGLGVDQIQVTLRSRDVHELHDQLRIFGSQVAPLVADAAAPR